MQANELLKKCSEERRGALKKQSLCQENVEDLEASIRKLKSELQDQSVNCGNAALESQAQCSSETERISLKLQAAEQQLEASNGRISALVDELRDASSTENQLVAERTQCESEATQNQSLCQENVAELQEKLTASEAAREDSESQASAVFAIRAEARSLTEQLQEERKKCSAVSAQLQAECDGHVQEIQKQMQTKCAATTTDIETLAVEVQTCQAALADESVARQQAMAQAALHESLHAKVSGELKQKDEQLIEHDVGKQACDS